MHLTIGQHLTNFGIQIVRATAAVWRVTFTSGSCGGVQQVYDKSWLSGGYPKQSCWGCRFATQVRYAQHHSNALGAIPVWPGSLPPWQSSGCGPTCTSPTCIRLCENRTRVSLLCSSVLHYRGVCRIRQACMRVWPEPLSIWVPQASVKGSLLVNLRLDHPVLIWQVITKLPFHTLLDAGTGNGALVRLMREYGKPTKLIRNTIDCVT